MHFEILVEDGSGKILLKVILEKMFGLRGVNHLWDIRAFKGIGRLPRNHTEAKTVKSDLLLNNLPKLLKAYGRSLRAGHAVVVVLDLDRENCRALKSDLTGILNDCNPAPKTLFRIAIEEMEAWILGDRKAILQAYPKAKTTVLDSYVQDSICGTWEKLADALYAGGSTKIKNHGWRLPGRLKSEWAENIGPLMDINNNRSVSFQVFRDGLRSLSTTSNI